MRLTRWLTVAALALVGVGLGSSASAHTALTASTPEADQVLSSLGQVRLEFNEDLLQLGAVVRVLDSAGVDHALGEPLFPLTNVVTIAVGDLAPGAHAVEWRVVSEDGHPVEGAIPFSIEAAAVVVGPSEAVPVPSLVPAASATPFVPEDVPGVFPYWALYSIIAIALAGLAAFALVRTPHSDD